MRIISFYTDPDYHKCIQRLQKSADKFGYQIATGYFPNASTWNAAIREKVRYILDQYVQGGGPLLYIDADTEIKSRLDTLKQFILEHDICVRERNIDKKNRFNCGVMGFGQNRKPVLAFIKTWHKLVQRNGDDTQTVDQWPFIQALELHKKIKLKKLDAPYNFLDSDMIHNYTMTDAVIYHYKASRTSEKARKWRKFQLWKQQNEPR